MYSQKNEEAAILSVVGDRKGTFLDIGAYDGINYSNTMALVDRGWSGTMVEPALEAFTALLRNHDDNDRIQLIHAAVGTDWGLVPFWNNPRTFSTTELTNTQKFHFEGFAKPFLTPMVPLSAILDITGNVDVVSIDTEGTSVELFKDLLEKVYPSVICVEHDGKFKECLEMAGRMGSYKQVLLNEENLIVARP